METNTGACQLFDQQAHLIAAHLDDLRHNRPSAIRFTSQIRTDLSNGLTFDPSPRHTGYADRDAFTRYLKRFSKAYEWPLSSVGGTATTVAQRRTVTPQFG